MNLPLLFSIGLHYISFKAKEKKKFFGSILIPFFSQNRTQTIPGLASALRGWSTYNFPGRASLAKITPGKGPKFT
jgi:hypothetical protein